MSVYVYNLHIMYVCVYVCIYIYKYTYIYIFKYTYTYMCTHRFTTYTYIYRPLTPGGPRARARRPVGPARGPVWPVGPWARRGP